MPQPEGTPLPDRNPKIADNWPVEVKQLIDNMLALYPAGTDQRPPSVKEVERRVGITLTERPLEPTDANFTSKQFVVGGTRFIDPTLHKYGLGDRYSITRATPPGSAIQALTLVVSPKQTGFCLNPYELAVYTGSSFSNADTSPHAIIRHWPPAYVWGMFLWSRTGDYRGQGFRIALGQDRDVVTQAITNAGCVRELTVYGPFQEEKNK